MKIKYFSLSLIICLLLSPWSFASVRNVQDNYQVVYNVIDENGDHVGSETITLKIKRVSDGFWFDFNDSTFKSSAWTSKSTNLTEDATEGFYHYTYDPPASETGAEQYQFLLDNASVTYGDHQSFTVSYQAVNTTNLDASISSLNDITAADVWANGTRTLTAFSFDAGLTAAAIDDIWNEPQSGHTTAGTFGKYLDSEVSAAGGGGLTAGAIADAVWDEAQADHVTTGTMGKSLSNASSAGDPWDTDVSTGYVGKAGQYLRKIYRARR